MMRLIRAARSVSSMVPRPAAPRAAITPYRVLACALAISATSFGLQPAYAADEAIVLVGGRTTYVDVTFDGPVTVREIGTQIAYKGSYAGWLIHAVGERFDREGETVAGGFLIRGLLPSHYPQDPIDFGPVVNPTLDPGRYRLYLLADGFARVTIPADGLGKTLSLSPSMRTTSHADAEELDLSLGNAGSARGRFPVESSSSTLSVSILAFYSRRGANVSNLDVCFAKRGKDCDGRYGGTGYTFALVPDDWGVGWMVSYAPGVLGDGKYDGVQAFDGAGTVYSVRGGVIQVDTVP
ncbi:MAG: hypothetical protein M3285_04560 [Actinomycetota bacterium]|nr:hypothetical protein [Actinomycetota bacterium]MDQ3954804.1 hypothetical protein [Actinomycetota bacterium]